MANGFSDAFSCARRLLAPGRGVRSRKIGPSSAKDYDQAFKNIQVLKNLQKNNSFRPCSFVSASLARGADF